MHAAQVECPGKHQQKHFCDDEQQLIAADTGHLQLLFSDEVILHINAMVNSHCKSQLLKENLRFFTIWPMHLESVAVWCKIWREGIIGQSS